MLENKKGLRSVTEGKVKPKVTRKGEIINMHRK